MRAARPYRRQERALPQHRQGHVRRRLRAQPASPEASGTYGLGVSTLDFNDDGWIDLYVANDSNPSALYREQPGRHVQGHRRRSRAAPTARTASRRPAWASRSATTTATARWISSRPTSPATPRRSTRTAARASATTARSRPASASTRAGSDGASASSTSTTTAGPTCSSSTATSTPRSTRVKTEAGYKQRKVVYRNLGNGRFEDVTERLGPPVTTPAAGRGAAFADLDNDGDIDVVVNNVHAAPDLFRLDSPADAQLADAETGRHAVESQRDRRAGAGCRPAATQVQEVRGGGSYYSQNDLRVHFGLGGPTAVDRVEVRWPNGLEEQWSAPATNRIVTLTEGTGTALAVRSDRQLDAVDRRLLVLAWLVLTAVPAAQELRAASGCRDGARRGARADQSGQTGGGDRAADAARWPESPRHRAAAGGGALPSQRLRPRDRAAGADCRRAAVRIARTARSGPGPGALGTSWPDASQRRCRGSRRRASGRRRTPSSDTSWARPTSRRARAIAHARSSPAHSASRRTQRRRTS